MKSDKTDCVQAYRHASRDMCMRRSRSWPSFVSFVLTMADLRSLSREFLREFIEIYKETPCLWQTKNKDFSNKQKKSAAYQKLSKKLAEVEKDETKDSVVKKINSLRTCFRKEHRKVLAFERSGTGTDQLYTPTLWYYELLLFLIDQDEPRPSISNIPDDEEIHQDRVQVIKTVTLSYY